MLYRDPLIQIFNNNRSLLELLGRVWELLYIEGSSPEIGKRRENFIIMMLKYELKLDVERAPPTEPQWDFKVKIHGKWHYYNLKTTERISTIKVAWNGFPSPNRILSYKFKYPILYISVSRENGQLLMCVFRVNNINKVLSEKGIEFWQIPRQGTNPRGFGIRTSSIRQLIDLAHNEGNCIFYYYNKIENIEEIANLYWKEFYNLLKRLAFMR